ncbi:MAG: hypothetical protein ACKOA9_09015 [Actinomycetota bacterium]
MTRRAGVRRLMALVATLAGVVLLAAPALAATTVPIRIGNTGETIGTATFTRTLQGDGTERIAMTLDVTGSGRTLDVVNVCVGGDPFTGRIPPGRCRFGVTGLSGTTFTRDLDLGTEYVGRRVCLQPHLEVLSTDGRSTDTGYAGWVSGKPFFGSLCFESVGTEVPLGATGVLGLSALLATGLGVVALGRRRTATPSAR